MCKSLKCKNSTKTRKLAEKKSMGSNPTIEALDNALEVLQERLEWLRINAPIAKNEMASLNDAIISLLAWREDLREVSE